jgi:hypothetical protein
MKLAKTFVVVGGIANALFFLFHLFLGWKLHQLQVAPPLRSLLEMLNGGGALFILFLAFASLAYAEEVLSTRLGRAVLLLGTSLYVLRALAEFVVAPTASPAIYLTCFVTGGLYLLPLMSHRRVAINA